MDRENFMNLPIEEAWTEEDVRSDCRLYQDCPKVAKRYGITVKQVREIERKRLNETDNGFHD